jgi:hypothetical protein
LLAASLLDSAAGRNLGDASFVVNEHVPLGMELADGRAINVTKPDGTNVTLASNESRFTQTDIPGLYSIKTTDGIDTFAVNLDPMESRTTPLEAETLEQFGCRLVTPTAIAEHYQRRQYLQDIQLERRQKFWQWLVLAALGMAVAETWLAGRATKRGPEGSRA